MFRLNSSFTPRRRVQVFESWIKRSRERYGVFAAPLSSVASLSVFVRVCVMWSVHFSPMRDLVLNSDAPPLMASVPSLQVTLTAPLMHIH